MANIKTSIVDLLKSLGLPTDKESRKKLAATLGIEGYDLSADKNQEFIERINILTPDQINAIKLNAPIPVAPEGGLPIDDSVLNPRLNDIKATMPLMELVKASKGKQLTSPTNRVRKPQLDPIDARSIENQAKQLAKDALDVQQFKQQGIGETVKAGIQGLTGLGQMIAGRKIKKGLTEPKYPEELQNVQLNTRLAEAQREAQMTDPAIRERMMRDLVRNKLMQDEYAKVASGGDISAYGALTQAAQTRNIDAYRDMAAQEAADKLAKQQVYDTLLRQKVEDDARRYGNQVQRFRSVDYPEFQARRDYGSALTNQGMTGLFNAGQNVLSNAMPLMTYSRGLAPQLKSRLAMLPPKEQQRLNEQYRFF